MDEISRLINFYNPSELLFQTENYELTRDDVINKWDLNHECFRINHLNDPVFKKSLILITMTYICLYLNHWKMASVYPWVEIYPFQID